MTKQEIEIYKKEQKLEDTLKEQFLSILKKYPNVLKLSNLILKKSDAVKVKKNTMMKESAMTVTIFIVVLEVFLKNAVVIIDPVQKNMIPNIILKE